MVFSPLLEYLLKGLFPRYLLLFHWLVNLFLNNTVQLFHLFLFTVFSTRNWTQGLVHDRQTKCYWVAVQLFFILFGERVLLSCPNWPRTCIPASAPELLDHRQVPLCWVHCFNCTINTNFVSSFTIVNVPFLYFNFIKLELFLNSIE